MMLPSTPPCQAALSPRKPTAYGSTPETAINRLAAFTPRNRSEDVWPLRDIATPRTSLVKRFPSPSAHLPLRTHVDNTVAAKVCSENTSVDPRPSDLMGSPP